MNLEHAIERIHQLETILGMKEEFKPEFTRTECVMLGLLLRRETVSRDVFFDALYGKRAFEDIPDPKTVEVLLSKLRKKLAGKGIKITTWYNVGYSLDEANKKLVKELCQ